jgi:hypothetical protein
MIPLFPCLKPESGVGQQRATVVNEQTGRDANASNTGSQGETLRFLPYG